MQDLVIYISNPALLWHCSYIKSGGNGASQLHDHQAVQVWTLPQLLLDHEPEPLLDAMVPAEEARQTWAQACHEMGLSHFIQVPASKET